jgi:hypothetical protein
MGGVGWLVRHELRSRWRSVLGLALVVGLIAGVVLASAAGARRTATAYERFAAATAVRDVQVQIDDGDVDVTLDAIEALDLVGASGRLEIIPVVPVDESLLTEVDLALFASPDGRWAIDVDRPLLLAGRMPDPSTPGEVVLNELAAAQTGLVVGDRFTVATFTPDQLLALQSGGPFTGFGGPEVDLQVVGVGRQATDLQGADIAAGGVLLTSQATHRVLDGHVGGLGGLLGVRLAPRATIDQLRSSVREIVGPDASFDVSSSETEFAAGTRESTRVLAQALAAFAAVASVAGAVAIGGSVSRQCVTATATGRTLAALGCDRRQRAATIAAVPTVAIVTGTFLGVLGAVLASGLFPVSVARRVEPDPGMRLEPLVLSVGALVVLVAGLAWTLVTVRRMESRRPQPAARRSWASLAVPPTASVGIAHAFDRRAAGRTVPVRAALTAAVVGVVGVVGCATVIRSFDALRDDPRRYGWAWSAEPDFYTDDPAALFDELASTPGVATVAARHSARLELGGLVVPGMAIEDHHGSTAVPLRAGRLPVSVDEVVVGQHTADALGASIGDRVEAATAAGGETIDVEIVGIGVFAPVETPDPASGALVTTDALEQLRRSDGFTSLLVGYEPGFDPSGLERSFAERDVADFSVVYARPRLPGGLQNLHRAMPIVAALGAFFAAVAMAAVAHALVVGTQRRRHDLATLRALGMRRRQVRTVVALSALATVVVGVAVGGPLGVIAGRSAWGVIIAGHGVLDAPSLPVVVLVALVPVALLLALAASWRPAVSATRHTALTLRSE